MQLSQTIQAARENKVRQMMTATGCSRDYAIAYLMTAQWYLSEAIDNYRATH